MMRLVVLSLLLASATARNINGRSKDSCAGRCGGELNHNYNCQCNHACVRHGDCCQDYNMCNSRMSCKGRCSEAYDHSNPCHCNSKCDHYNNCCQDYHSQCQVSNPGGDFTNQEILQISEEIYSLDVNKATENDIRLNLQGPISNSQTGDEIDRAQLRLYTYVNEDVLFTKPTFAKFIALLDNYNRMTGIPEEFTPEQLREEDAFLNEIMKTPIMNKLYSVLHSKNLYNSVTDFKEDLKKMWFGLYSRANTALDSSGFEHVFSGEVKRGKVSGFHNWVRFYFAEKNKELNYYSYNYDGPWTNYPEVLAMQFNWNGYYKEVGSEIIGSSPEFDFAIYTLCFIAKPDKSCTVSLGGKTINIQTYTWTKSTYGNGKKYVASTFPLTP
ncbi:uridylate-specific endoribonuclease A [Hypanus sabinus]|uniref:uridylate-specific endoribonuclease A n=1 Tax=Hypanus sabinus TaxID=79690 RepID=UPI0028C4C1E5|nr:uridylate-specific endoribonuclease A [Hypanus sabinus]